jgi:hypothetical protein
MLSATMDDTITVLVAEGPTVLAKVHPIGDVPKGLLVYNFIETYLKAKLTEEALTGKTLYRESDGKVVVAGKELQFYKDDEGDTTVSFILKAPPITTSAAGAGVTGVAGAGEVNSE